MEVLFDKVGFISGLFGISFIILFCDSMMHILPWYAPRQKKLGLPPPILQIMILKLSPPRCVISMESVQQKWIDELWFRKQLSTCLFVWTHNHNSWAPGHRPGWPSLNGSACLNLTLQLTIWQAIVKSKVICLFKIAHKMYQP